MLVQSIGCSSPARLLERRDQIAESALKWANAWRNESEGTAVYKRRGSGERHRTARSGLEQPEQWLPRTLRERLLIEGVALIPLRQQESEQLKGLLSVTKQE